MARTVTNLFFLFVALKSLVESYLDKRNRQYILKHKNEVPEKFAEKISLEEHKKAASYSVTKINTARVFHVYGLITLFLWTLGGGLQSLDMLSSSFHQGPILTGVIFFALFMLISTLLGLPESIYSTFVIEERFGFNKTTKKLFIIDLVKSLVVGAIIGLPIVAGLLWFMESAGDNWWLYAWIFLTVIQFVLMWAYPTFIAPMFNKFTPLEDGEVKDRILDLMQRTGFESNGLFIMDASRRSAHGNAYFTGFGKNKRIVFFDNLIKTLEPSEVEAVLAHELGHFKKKHVTKMLIRAVVFSFIGFFILGKLVTWIPFYQGHGVNIPSNHVALALFMLVSGNYTFFLTPIMSWLSRKQEFEADQFAADNADASKLISALVKLYKENASSLTTDPTYSAFYHSHPPAPIRVDFLEKISGNGSQNEESTMVTS